MIDTLCLIITDELEPDPSRAAGESVPREQDATSPPQERFLARLPKIKAFIYLYRSNWRVRRLSMKAVDLMVGPCMRQEGGQQERGDVRGV